MPTHLTVLGLWPAAPHPRFGRGARPASGSLSRPRSRCTPGLRAGCSRGLERSSPVFSPGRLLLVMTRTFLSPGALSRRAPTAVAALHHATPGALFPAQPPPAISAGVTDVMGTAATVAAGSLTAPTRSRHAYVIPHAFIVGLLAPEREPHESRGRDVLVHSVPSVPGRMPGSSRLLNEHRVTPRAEM